MRNITKKPILNKNLLDLEYENEWIGGLCVLGRSFYALQIYNSRFEMINSHCIGLKTASITFKNVTFNNSELESPTIKINDESIAETSGVSWIILKIEPSIYRNELMNCKFIENKITPKYGGVK